MGHIELLEKNKKYAEDIYQMHTRQCDENPEIMQALRKWKSDECECVCAEKTDEHMGWECKELLSACLYFKPDSKRCVKEYGKWEGANGRNAADHD